MFQPELVDCKLVCLEIRLCKCSILNDYASEIPPVKHLILENSFAVTNLAVQITPQPARQFESLMMPARCFGRYSDWPSTQAPALFRLRIDLIGAWVPMNPIHPLQHLSINPLTSISSGKRFTL